MMMMMMMMMMNILVCMCDCASHEHNVRHVMSAYYLYLLVRYSRGEHGDHGYFRDVNF